MKRPPTQTLDGCHPNTDFVCERSHNCAPSSTLWSSNPILPKGFLHLLHGSRDLIGCQICTPRTCNSKHLVICKKMWTLEPRQRASKSCWSFSCWYSPRATAGAGPTNYLASFPASKQCKWISLMIWFHHIIDRLEWNLISGFDHLMWIHYQNWSKGSFEVRKNLKTSMKVDDPSDSNNSQLRDSTPLISPSAQTRHVQT